MKAMALWCLAVSLGFTTCGAAAHAQTTGNIGTGRVRVVVSSEERNTVLQEMAPIEFGTQRAPDSTQLPYLSLSAQKFAIQVPARRISASFFNR
jgi:hypothetical protein